MNNLPTKQEYQGLTNKLTNLELNVNTLKDDITQKVDTLGNKYDDFEKRNAVYTDNLIGAMTKTIETVRQK